MITTEFVTSIFKQIGRMASHGSANSFAWNLAGSVIPLFAALLVVPSLISGLGVEKFGMLSLCWITVGYFSLFDFGMGRALTHFIAGATGRGEDDIIPPSVWSGLWLMLALGCAVGFLTFVLSKPIAEHLAKGSSLASEEVSLTLALLAFSIPAVVLTAGLRGIMEAYSAFAAANMIRIPLGVASYLGPAIVLEFTTSLPPVVATVVGARLLATLAHLFFCAKRYPYMRNPLGISLSRIRPLLVFGGWMTLSNIAGPLLLYLGQFILASLYSVAAVAAFSTPYDLVVNFLIIPAAIVGVLFPQFGSRFANDAVGVVEIYKQGKILIFVTMLPVLIIAFFGARPFLTWWIGPGFADMSFRVAQILAVGVFINSFGHLSQSLVQASGRPDLTAKLHIAELVLYVPYALLLVKHFGVIGAALAWTLRVAISTIVLAIMAQNRIHAHTNQKRETKE